MESLVPLQNKIMCHVKYSVFTAWAFIAVSCLQTLSFEWHYTDLEQSIVWWLMHWFLRAFECRNEEQHTAKPGILKKYTFHLLPYCEILYFHGSYYKHTCLLGCAASTIYLMVDGGSTFLTNQHTSVRLHDVTSQKIVDTPQVLVNVSMNFQVLWMVKN